MHSDAGCDPNPCAAVGRRGAHPGGRERTRVADPGAGRRRADRGAREHLRDRRGCGGGAERLRPGQGRRLAVVAGRSAEQLQPLDLGFELPDAHPGRMRRLPARAACRQEHRLAPAGRDDRHRPRDPDPRAAAHLTGCLRLPGVRADGCAARPRSVHPDPCGSGARPRLPVHRMALPALAIRAAVHHRQLRDRAAGTRRRALGPESRDRGSRASRRSPSSPARPAASGTVRAGPRRSSA